MLKTLEQSLQINKGNDKQKSLSIELLEREKLKKIIDRFGKSLDILDSDIEHEVVKEHLEHLGLLPKNLISVIKIWISKLKLEIRICSVCLMTIVLEKKLLEVHSNLIGVEYLVAMMQNQYCLRGQRTSWQ